MAICRFLSIRVLFALLTGSYIVLSAVLWLSCTSYSAQYLTCIYLNFMSMYCFLFTDNANSVTGFSSLWASCKTKLIEFHKVKDGGKYHFLYGINSCSSIMHIQILTTNGCDFHNIYKEGSSTSMKQASKHHVRCKFSFNFSVYMYVKTPNNCAVSTWM